MKNDQPIEDELNFDEALKKLREIVEKFEKSDPGLEESLKLLTEGKKLYNLCQKKLKDAQLKVTTIFEDRL